MSGDDHHDLRRHVVAPQRRKIAPKQMLASNKMAPNSSSVLNGQKRKLEDLCVAQNSGILIVFKNLNVRKNKGYLSSFTKKKIF